MDTFAKKAEFMPPGNLNLFSESDSDQSSDDDCSEESSLNSDDDNHDQIAFSSSTFLRYNQDIFHKPWIAQLDMMGLSKFVRAFFEANVFSVSDDRFCYKTTEEEINFRDKFASFSDKDLRVLGFRDRHISIFREYFPQGEVPSLPERRPRFAEGPKRVLYKDRIDYFILYQEKKIVVNQLGYVLTQDAGDPGYFRTDNLRADVQKWINRRKFRRRCWGMTWLRQMFWYENLYYADSLAEKKLALDVNDAIRCKIFKVVLKSTIFSRSTLEIIATYVPIVRIVPLLRFTSKWENCRLVAQEEIELWEHEHLDEVIQNRGIKKWCLIDAKENPRSGFFMTQFLHDYRDQTLEIETQILVKEILWTPGETRICEVPCKDTPRKLFD